MLYDCIFLILRVNIDTKHCEYVSKRYFTTSFIFLPLSAMNTPSQSHWNIEYAKNWFPRFTTEYGVVLTFQEKPDSHQSLWFIADETWQFIAQKYEYLNPDRHNPNKEIRLDDQFSIKHSIKRWNKDAFKLFLEPKSKIQLEEIYQDVSNLYSSIEEFIKTSAYQKYMENHDAWWSWWMRFKPEYSSLLSDVASFLSVIQAYMQQYDETMRHVQILKKSWHLVYDTLSA